MILLFSALHPSCIRYKIGEESIIPVFEDELQDYPYKYLVSEIQSHALRFVEDFCKCFGEIMNSIHMRNMDISYPFEHMLAFPEDTDLKMFNCILFEDDMWAGKNISLSEQWSENIKYHRLEINHKIQTRLSYEKTYEVYHDDIPLAWKLYNQKGMEQKNKISKVIFWLVNDRQFLWQRIKEKMKIRSYI